MILKRFDIKDEVIVGRIKKGSDLILELTKICEENNIINGIIEGIGALEYVTIGYYDQKNKEYIINKIDKPMEVLCLKGNVSLKADKPMVHAHIVLGDKKGEVFGGHLFEGSSVFAFEYYIISLGKGFFRRKLDPETGLYLWIDQ